MTEQTSRVDSVVFNERDCEGGVIEGVVVEGGVVEFVLDL